MSRKPKTSAPPAPAITTPAEKLADYFGAQRWEKIQRQAARSCGLDADGLQALCARMMDTRAAHYPDNAAAALAAAAQGLLIGLGSRPTQDDLQRFRHALSNPAD